MGGQSELQRPESCTLHYIFLATTHLTMIYPSSSNCCFISGVTSRGLPGVDLKAPSILCTGKGWSVTDLSCSSANHTPFFELRLTKA